MQNLSLKNKIWWFVITLFGVGLLAFIIAKFGALAALIIPILIGCILLAYYIFKNPLFGFCLIVFFLPFERVPTYNVGGADIKINVILGFITLFAWLLALMFNSQKWRVNPSALTLPITLFIISLLLSLTQAFNLSRAIQVLIFTLFTIALSFLANSMIQSKEDLKKIIGVLFLSSLVAGAFGLFQFAGDVVGLPQSLTLLKEGYTSAVFGFPRVQAFSMEPLYFANYLIIPLSLLIAYFLAKVKFSKKQEDKFWDKWIANPWFIFALLVLLGVNFVLTVSRGGYLGLVVVVLIYLFVFFRKVFSFRNILIMAVAGILVYWGVTYALSQGQARASREFFGHVTLNDLYEGESIQGRLNTFEFAYSAFEKNPVLGIGVGNYGPYAKHYPVNTPKYGWDIVNNQFIETLAETGLVGFIAFVLIFFVLLIRSLIAIRLTSDLFLKTTLIGLTAAMVGILVQYNFFSTLYIIHIWVAVGLLAGTQQLAFKQKSLK